MYENLFKLAERPFLAAPNTARYFPATVIENARQTLCRAIERGAGTGLVIGPAGTGKTLLCQMLAEEFENRFAIAYLANGCLSNRQALLQAILYELRLPYQGLDEGELRLSLLDFLEPTPDGSDGLLLIVDEAHALPGRLLEEIRMLTNLVRGGQPRVRVLLAGGPRLEERFADPRLSAFSQRLAARCYLESLDSVETAAYVRAQLASVGGDSAKLVDDEALRAVSRSTDGVPRLINQVCDHALILAGLAGLGRLSSEIIDEAWADLQQLPSPWTSPAGENHDQVVEFGGLDDNDEERPTAIPFRTAEPRPLQMTEPTVQLDIIADHLASIEQTYKPAGSIGSEVELAVPEFGDPFSEEFAEEEVVLERYGAAVDLFAAAPRVSSFESRQLGAAIGPAFESTRQSVPMPPLKFEPRSGDQQGVTIHPVRAALPTQPASSEPRPLDVGAPAIGRGPAAAPQPQGDDLDLIVVEDETRQSPIPPAPAQSVRKLEYRQLFAKLRRG
jgi:type II secretory pathway predicted ATPase ExeA